jgi:DinB superfamily
MLKEMGSEEMFTEVIAKLSAVPDQVEALVRGLSEEQLSWNPPTGMFSLRENVYHLRDIDVEGYLERIRLVMDEDHPTLPDVDGARLAKERNYNARPIQPALEDLRAARATSIARLKCCSDQDMERQAEMQGVGTVNLRRLLELWTEHDAGHLADMAELRLAIESGKEPSFVPHQAA